MQMRLHFHDDNCPCSEYCKFWTPDMIAVCILAVIMVLFILGCAYMDPIWLFLSRVVENCVN